MGKYIIIYLETSQVAQWLRVCLPSRRSWFDPWVGNIPGEGNSNPLQYSCPGNPMDRGACPWGHTKCQAQFSD